MAQVNFRTYDMIKEKAEKACAAMGLTMSAGINIFLTMLANEKKIPFEVAVDPFNSEENMARLKKSISNLNKGKARYTK